MAISFDQRARRRLRVLQKESQDQTLGSSNRPNRLSGWQQAEARDRRQKSMGARRRDHRRTTGGLNQDSDTRTEKGGCRGV